MIVLMIVLGAIMGSFSLAMVWRLRASQLRYDKSKSKEAKRLINKVGLTKDKMKDDYSRCLNCGHKLSALDLVPVFSWLFLRGKCRYCKKPIGYLEIITEVGLATVFGLIYYLKYDNLVSFVLLIGLLIAMTILLIYDYKWLLMPTNILWVFIILALTYAGVRDGANLSWQLVLDYILSLMIMSGLYLILYLISKGRWVGSGDIYLGFGLGLILGDWVLALVALLLANLLGSLVALVMFLLKKPVRGAKLPLGPFLIMGWLMTFLSSSLIVEYFYYFY